MKLRWCTAVFVFLLAASDARADRIVLNNGDRLSGKIEDLSADPLEIETDSIGTVSVSKDKIASVKTDVETAAEKAEDERRRARWQGELSAGYSANSGNTENALANAELLLKREKGESTYELHGRSTYGSQDRKMNAQSHYGKARIERSVGQTPWLYFGQIEADSDRFANVDWRLVPSGGAGYKFFDRDDLKLRLEAGIGYTHTAFRDDSEPTDDVTLVPRVTFEKRFGRSAVFSQDLKYYPSLTGGGQYRIVSDTRLDTPLNERLSVRFQVYDQYQSLPGADKKSNDVSLVSGLVQKF